MSVEIEQRITRSLLGSGLVASVGTARRGDALDLHMIPAAHALVDERMLRLFLHWTGDRRRDFWSPRPYENPWFVDVSPEDITVSVRGVSWTGESIGQHEELARLLVLSLSFAPPAHASTSLDLLHRYHDRTEVESACVKWMARVLIQDEDAFTNSCVRELRPYWLCCERHRVLLLERLVLRDWLSFFFSGWNSKRDYPKAAPYGTAVLTVEEARSNLARALRPYEGPLDYLQALFAHKAGVEERGWAHPTRQCHWKQHERFKCCPTHIALSAMNRLFDAWAQFYDDVYHISSKHRTLAGFFDRVNIALLLHAAGIDATHIRFSSWFRDVAEVDINSWVQC